MRDHITRFRRFNRFYTNTLGLLRRRLLDSPLGLAEARVLFEIRQTPGIHAVALARSLGMDRGQLSRIIAKLHRSGHIARSTAPSGRKGVPLHPARAGLKLLEEIDAAADRQAQQLLGHLDGPAADALTAALDTAHRLLAPCGSDATEGGESPVIIRTAESGDLAWIIDRHAALYQSEHGFNADFEKYVLLGLAAYLELPDPSRSRIFIAERAGQRLGSVAVVQSAAARGQLRWLLVTPQARGLGTGRALVRQALEFAADAGYGAIFLWTLSFLKPARRLYESFGFTLAESKQSTMGGTSLTEERWELVLR